MKTEHQTLPEVAIFGALRRHVWLVLAGTIIAAGAGYVVAAQSTPKYEAEASLLFRFDREYSPRNLASDGWHGEPIRVNLDGAIHNELEILGSRRLLRESLARFEPASAIPDISALRAEPTLDQLLARFQDAMSIRRVEGTSIARLSFTHADPDFAAAFLRNLIDTHLSTRSSFLNWSPSESIREVVDWSEARLLDAQRNLTEFRAESMNLDVEATRANLLERRADLRIGLIQLTPDTPATMQTEIAAEIGAIEAELAALAEYESRLEALEGAVESAAEQFRNAREILAEQELSERLAAAHGPSIIYLDQPATNPNPVGLSAGATSVLSGILGFALASLLGLWLSRNSSRPPARKAGGTPKQEEPTSLVAALRNVAPRQKTGPGRTKSSLQR
jgi:uncharacterized protein involved in exopolysaccharide biosynthesis